MVIVSGEIVVEEGAVDRVRDALRTMEDATRKEPGCLTYAFSVDISAPTVMRIFERWESMDALKAHLKMPHMGGRRSKRTHPNGDRRSVAAISHHRRGATRCGRIPRLPRGHAG